MCKCSCRQYLVGGIRFDVSIETPWNFMDYTEPVLERISRAAAGLPVDTIPTRAGDEVPARTYVTRREELPENRDAHTLDFSQYEPFLANEAGEADFALKICAGKPQWIIDAKAQDRLKPILMVDKQMPCFYIYSFEGDTIVEFDADRGHIIGTLRIGSDCRKAEYYPEEGCTARTTQFHLSTVLMLLYTCNAARFNALLMHASVVRINGHANLFLGKSGTGKSTHCRLWLENIAGTELINDDNPVLRIEDGQVYVYGSPWSGKTPCYRNIKVPVRNIVSLNQAPENKLSRVELISAYADIYSSASSIRWDKDLMNHISATISGIATTIPCWHLGCTPYPEAAKVCLAVEN